jgi:hypothetical protein
MIDEYPAQAFWNSLATVPMVRGYIAWCYHPAKSLGEILGILEKAQMTFGFEYLSVPSSVRSEVLSVVRAQSSGATKLRDDSECYCRVAGASSL